MNVSTIFRHLGVGAMAVAITIAVTTTAMADPTDEPSHPSSSEQEPISTPDAPFTTEIGAPVVTPEETLSGEAAPTTEAEPQEEPQEEPATIPPTTSPESTSATRQTPTTTTTALTPQDEREASPPRRAAAEPSTEAVEARPMDTAPNGASSPPGFVAASDDVRYVNRSDQSELVYVYENGQPIGQPRTVEPGQTLVLQRCATADSTCAFVAYSPTTKQQTALYQIVDRATPSGDRITSAPMTGGDGYGGGWQSIDAGVLYTNRSGHDQVVASSQTSPTGVSETTHVQVPAGSSVSLSCAAGKGCDYTVGVFSKDRLDFTNEGLLMVDSAGRAVHNGSGYSSGIDREPGGLRYTNNGKFRTLVAFFANGVDLEQTATVYVGDSLFLPPCHPSLRYCTYTVFQLDEDLTTQSSVTTYFENSGPPLTGGGGTTGGGTPVTTSTPVPTTTKTPPSPKPRPTNIPKPQTTKPSPRPTTSQPKPAHYGEDRWVDCGPKVCTVYWNRATTRRLADGLNGLAFEIGKDALAAGQCSVTAIFEKWISLIGEAIASQTCSAVVEAQYEAKVETMASAAMRAKKAGACLQVSYAKGDEGGRQTWGVTSNDRYCS
ncbi:hypothetical protein MTX35_13630 [Rhodococcus sp. ARC_M12]|uniref:hypothetical protein n=1 Tax=Rhodococcus sp. ARC_M12 TaxID=2928854 RepID=UPI001FB3CD05|nr:hypothetical protein [Rhodococcus sp. ARC_M12]MCJ0978753.1 hypothetical protein [Rhodococcus sp. ARC_M12]